MLLQFKSANWLSVLLIAYFILDEGRTLAEAVEIATRAGFKCDELEEAALWYVEERRSK